MGLNIKTNKKGLYNMQSSITDSSIHPEQKWITEDEAKKVLINREFWRFVEKIIEIDMEFPVGYHVNGQTFRDDRPKFNKWWLDMCDDEKFEEIEFNKFIEIHDKLGLEFDFKR